MVRFNDQNPGQRLIAVFIANDAAATGLATKTNSGIKAPSDLAGKTLASPQGDGSRQLFPLFARINKLDEGSIKWINVSPELREPMLIRDQVDAISGDGPTIMLNMRALQVRESDIRIIRYVDYGLDLYGKALVVRPEYAEKNPEVVRNFIRAVAHGMAGLITNPDAAVASVQKRDALLQSGIEKARIKMTLDWAIVTPNVLKNGLSGVDLARLDRSLKQVAEGVQLKTVPAVSDVYTDRYLPPRDELKIRNEPALGGTAAGFAGESAAPASEVDRAQAFVQVDDASLATPAMKAAFPPSRASRWRSGAVNLPPS